MFIALIYHNKMKIFLLETKYSQSPSAFSVPVRLLSPRDSLGGLVTDGADPELRMFPEVLAQPQSPAAAVELVAVQPQPRQGWQMVENVVRQTGQQVGVQVPEIFCLSNTFRVLCENLQNFQIFQIFQRGIYACYLVVVDLKRQGSEQVITKIRSRHVFNGRRLDNN